LAVRAVGDKPVETGFGFRTCIRAGDAGDIEAACARLRDQRGLDLAGLGQKSRSA
jgi:hypothetical protein